LLRSLDLAPDNPNSYGTIAQLERRADNLPAAFDWQRRASEVDPQDHELVTQIAKTLYRLQLPEEGDYWAARAQALAPRSGLVRSLEVERAAARDDMQELITVASSLIGEQIENRQGAFDDTMYLYADAMLRSGRAQEAYEFLASVRPDAVRYDQVASDDQGLTMQWASIGLMTGFESFENRQAAWNQFIGQLETLGTPWLQNPADGIHLWSFVINGEIERAVDHYLEYELARPLADNLDRHRKLHYLFFAPVYEDPRVAAGLAADARRFAAVREEVRAMLQRPEWSKP
jgi:hypothetical protein